MLNPKYVSAKGLNTPTGKKLIYSENVDMSKHQKFVKDFPSPTSQTIWPQFSIDKINFLPGETLKDLLVANAIVLGETDREIYEIYIALASKKISLATPFFNNIRRADSHNYASCFILEVEDSLESIMKSITYSAQISKAGGAVGVNIGLIRAAGSTIAGRLKAAQPISVWAKMFDQVCVAVNQLGQRPGAMTIALPIWHSDIQDFLEMGTEAGDLRTKCYNIQSQICIGKDFMEAVLNDDQWPLYSPDDLRAIGIDPRETQNQWFNRAFTYRVERKMISARVLWSQIQELQMTVGRPYIFFEDNVNNGSPFANLGSIRSANLCVESYSFFRADEYIHTCALGSVNLPSHDSYKEIQESAYLLAGLIDKSIDMIKIDIPEINKHIRDFRTIGVGIMGLADWLAKNNWTYSHLKEIREASKQIAIGAYRSSLNRAEKYGACVRNNDLVPSSIQIKIEEEFPILAKQREKYGVRNALTTCTAPNTSTSITMGSCPSFLPPYDLDGWIEDNEDRASQVHLKYTPEDYLLDIKTMPPAFVLEAAIAIQEWTDAGISCEFMLVKGKNTSQNKEFSELKIDAWRKDLKCIYYVRTTEANKNECESCAN